MRPDPYATPAIHAVVVACPSSPVGGAPQKDARCSRPSSTIFTLTIVDTISARTVEQSATRVPLAELNVARFTCWIIL